MADEDSGRKAEEEAKDEEDSEGWVLGTLTEDRSGARIHISQKYIDEHKLPVGRRNAVLVKVVTAVVKAKE